MGRRKRTRRRQNASMFAPLTIAISAISLVSTFAFADKNSSTASNSTTQTPSLSEETSTLSTTQNTVSRNTLSNSSLLGLSETLTRTDTESKSARTRTGSPRSASVSERSASLTGSPRSASLSEQTVTLSERSVTLSQRSVTLSNSTFLSESKSLYTATDNVITRTNTPTDNATASRSVEVSPSATLTDTIDPPVTPTASATFSASETLSVSEQNLSSTATFSLSTIVSETKSLARTASDTVVDFVVSVVGLSPSGSATSSTSTTNNVRSASGLGRNGNDGPDDQGDPLPLLFLLSPAGEWAWSLKSVMSDITTHLDSCYSQISNDGDDDSRSYKSLDRTNDPFSFFNRKDALVTYAEKLLVLVSKVDGSLAPYPSPQYEPTTTMPNTTLQSTSLAPQATNVSTASPTTSSPPTSSVAAARAFQQHDEEGNRRTQRSSNSNPNLSSTSVDRFNRIFSGIAHNSSSSSSARQIDESDILNAPPLPLSSSLQLQRNRHERRDGAQMTPANDADGSDASRAFVGSSAADSQSSMLMLSSSSSNIALSNYTSGEVLVLHVSRDGCYDPKREEVVYLVRMDELLIHVSEVDGGKSASPKRRPLLSNTAYAVTVRPASEEYRKIAGLVLVLLTVAGLFAAWALSGTGGGMPLILLSLVQLKVTVLSRLCTRLAMSEYGEWALWVVAPTLYGDVFLPESDNHFGVVLIHFIIATVFIVLFMGLTRFRPAARLSFPRVPLTVGMLLQVGLCTSAWYNLINGENAAMRTFSFLLQLIYTAIMLFAVYKIAFNLPLGLSLLPYKGAIRFQVVGAYVPEQLLHKYSVVIDPWLPPNSSYSGIMGTRAAILHQAFIQVVAFLCGFLARGTASDCLIVFSFIGVITTLYGLLLLLYRPCRWRIFFGVLVADVFFFALLIFGAVAGVDCGATFPRNRVFGEVATVLSLVMGLVAAFILAGCSFLEQFKFAKELKKEKALAEARKQEALLIIGSTAAGGGGNNQLANISSSASKYMKNSNSKQFGSPSGTFDFANGVFNYEYHYDPDVGASPVNRVGGVGGMGSIGRNYFSSVVPPSSPAVSGGGIGSLSPYRNGLARAPSPTISSAATFPVGDVSGSGRNSPQRNTSPLQRQHQRLATFSAGGGVLIAPSHYSPSYEIDFNDDDPNDLLQMKRSRNGKKKKKTNVAAPSSKNTPQSEQTTLDIIDEDVEMYSPAEGRNETTTKDKDGKTPKKSKKKNADGENTPRRNNASFVVNVDMDLKLEQEENSNNVNKNKNNNGDFGRTTSVFDRFFKELLVVDNEGEGDGGDANNTDHHRDDDMPPPLPGRESSLTTTASGRQQKQRQEGGEGEGDDSSNHFYSPRMDHVRGSQNVVTTAATPAAIAASSVMNQSFQSLEDSIRASDNLFLSLAHPRHGFKTEAEAKTYFIRISRSFKVEMVPTVVNVANTSTTLMKSNSAFGVNSYTRQEPRTILVPRVFPRGRGPLSVPRGSEHDAILAAKVLLREIDAESMREFDLLGAPLQQREKRKEQQQQSPKPLEKNVGQWGGEAAGTSRAGAIPLSPLSPPHSKGENRRRYAENEDDDTRKREADNDEEKRRMKKEKKADRNRNRHIAEQSDGNDVRDSSAGAFLTPNASASVTLQELRGGGGSASSPTATSLSPTTTVKNKKFAPIRKVEMFDAIDFGEGGGGNGSSPHHTTPGFAVGVGFGAAPPTLSAYSPNTLRNMTPSRKAAAVASSSAVPPPQSGSPNNFSNSSISQKERMPPTRMMTTTSSLSSVQPTVPSSPSPIRAMTPLARQFLEEKRQRELEREERRKLKEAKKAAKEEEAEQRRLQREQDELQKAAAEEQRRAIFAQVEREMSLSLKRRKQQQAQEQQEKEKALTMAGESGGEADRAKQTQDITEHREGEDDALALLYHRRQSSSKKKRSDPSEEALKSDHGDHSPPPATTEEGRTANAGNNVKDETAGKKESRPLRGEQHAHATLSKQRFADHHHHNDGDDDASIVKEGEDHQRSLLRQNNSSVYSATVRTDSIEAERMQYLAEEYSDHHDGDGGEHEEAEEEEEGGGGGGGGAGTHGRLKHHSRRGQERSTSHSASPTTMMTVARAADGGGGGGGGDQHNTTLSDISAVSSGISLNKQSSPRDYHPSVATSAPSYSSGGGVSKEKLSTPQPQTPFPTTVMVNDATEHNEQPQQRQHQHRDGDNGRGIDDHGDSAEDAQSSVTTTATTTTTLDWNPKYCETEPSERGLSIQSASTTATTNTNTSATAGVWGGQRGGANVRSNGKKDSYTYRNDYRY